MAYGDAESRRRLGEDIGEKAKESEFATGRDVGRIGDPELVGRCRLELSIREIEGGSPRSFCTSLSTIGVVQSVPLCQTAHVTTGVGVRLQIDLMAPADIPAVVGLQTAFLNGSVVTELGSAFLTRFHAVALQHKASRAFVARDTSRRIVGFALGSVDVNGFNHFMKPRVLPSLVRALMAPSRLALIGNLARMMVEGEPQPPISAELLLLAVDPGARRQGIGGKLVHAMEDAFARDNVGRYRVAVRSHLAAARAFYSALNFEHEQERKVLGRPMLFLTKRVLAQ